MSAGYMRGCARKHRHETRQDAMDARVSMTGSRRPAKGALCVYRCIQCLGWHIGNTTNSFITRRRRAGKRPNKRMRGRV